MIENPILPGFHPDPSILRHGEDYWIATSTFEWLPGIRFHRSRDLVHWTPAGHALTRPSQIDLRGVAPSKGVWAPDLSQDETGRCWLAYSLVRNIADNFFDVDNWVVTAPQPDGPWSDPIYLNSSGFDPSLYHEKGRTWLVNLEWDFHPGHEHPGPLVLQEFSRSAGHLVGEPVPFYRGGSDLGCLEGGRIFRRGEFYYLMAAEGGTGYGHGVTLSRSRSIQGPWEPDPKNPIVTSARTPFFGRGNPQYLKPEQFNPASDLQKSGHGQIVETPGGETYLVHLCARPAKDRLRCVLGRETAIQKMEWQDGWLRLAAGGNQAQSLVPEPNLAPEAWSSEPDGESFAQGRLSHHWASPRNHIDSTWTSWDRPGWLGLRGRESLFSPFFPSVVARRVQHWDFSAQVRLAFSPTKYQQRAGLVCVYDTMNFLYLYLSWSPDSNSPYLGITQADNGTRVDPSAWRLPLVPATDGETEVTLRVVAQQERLQFFASLGGPWLTVGPEFDETILSDEYCKTGEFTGTFVGLAAEDLYRRGSWAWFTDFVYRGPVNQSTTDSTSKR